MTRSATDRPSPARRTARRGYTLIEVMIAVAIMTVGAVALMGMHRATQRGNLEARQRTTATQLVATWIERLHRDAIAWTSGGPTVPFTPLALARTTYLRNVVPVGSLPTWEAPVPPATSPESASFDHFGRDTRIPADMEFCTNLRLQWVYVGQAMRADVRVWYARTGESAVGRDLAGCGSGTAPEALTSRLRDVHFVHGSTVLRWTPVAAAFTGGGP